MNLEFIIFLIAQVLGIISWLLLIYSYTKEDIDRLLYIQILVCLFDFISYLLLGADAGLFICLIELIKTILYYKTTKDNIIFYVSLISYFLIGLLTIRHWFAILPVIASIIDSFGTSKDSKSANVCSIISNTLWTIYDLIILSYVGAFNDIVVVICNILILLFGYNRLMRINKFRIVKYNSLSKKNIEDIYKLDYNNFGELYTWNKEYQEKIFKKNKDSIFAIKYKHELVGYINYLNITLDEYEKIKRMKKCPSKIDIESIIPYTSNRKTYILIESINIKKEYEKNQTIELIEKKLNSFIKTKYRQRIYIHGILGLALTDFEKQVFKKMNYEEVKKLEGNVILYELKHENIMIK